MALPPLVSRLVGIVTGESERLNDDSELIAIESVAVFGEREQDRAFLSDVHRLWPYGIRAGGSSFCCVKLTHTSKGQINSLSNFQHTFIVQFLYIHLAGQS